MSKTKRYFRVFAGRDEKPMFRFGMIILLQSLLMLLFMLGINGTFTNPLFTFVISLLLGIPSGLRISNMLHKSGDKNAN